MNGTRRGFFGAMLAAILGRPIAKALPAIEPFTFPPAGFEWPPPYRALTFHRDAFAMVYPKIGYAVMVRRPVKFEDRAENNRVTGLVDFVADIKVKRPYENS